MPDNTITVRFTLREVDHVADLVPPVLASRMIAAVLDESVEDYTGPVTMTAPEAFEFVEALALAIELSRLLGIDTKLPASVMARIAVEANKIVAPEKRSDAQFENFIIDPKETK